MSSNNESHASVALKLLARIRFLEDCATRFIEKKEFPRILGYLPKHFTFYSKSSIDLQVFALPSVHADKQVFKLSSRHRVITSTSLEYNKDGLWVQIKMLASIDNNRPVNKTHLKDYWLILYSSKITHPIIEQVKNPLNSLDKSLFTTNKFPRQMISDVDDGSMDCGDHEAFDYGDPDIWIDLVEEFYQPFDKTRKNQINHLVSTYPNLMDPPPPIDISSSVISPLPHNTSRRLLSSNHAQSAPKIPQSVTNSNCESVNNIEHIKNTSDTKRSSNFPKYPYNDKIDESLCKLVANEHEVELNNLDKIVQSVKVSSGEETKHNLLTPDKEAWETGEGFEHYIEVKIRPGVRIDKLGIAIDSREMSYFPVGVVVSGGYSGMLSKLAEIPMDTSYETPKKEMWLLEAQTSYLEVIKINFKIGTNYDINDLKISGLLIKRQTNSFFFVDLYNEKYFIKYPLLSSISPQVLFYQQCIFQRLMDMYDSCIPHLYPSAQPNLPHSLNAKLSEAFNHLFALSKSRKDYIEIMLDKTAKNREGYGPDITLDRHLINDGIQVPFDQSVFYQIYTQVKPHKSSSSYRFAKDENQWWYCKFKMEGVSDQGGGFRESLTNLSEELCPSKEGIKPVFDLFIPSPNQNNPDTPEYRDEYIPNGACDKFDLYHWVGLLMGACFRTEDILTINLPGFFWRQLLGHQARWKDFVTVDHKEVVRLERIEKMTQDEFEAYFMDTNVWTCVTSDGRTIELSSAHTRLQYQDRFEYCRLCRQARMQEFKPQMEAIKGGFYEVVPTSAALLISLEELERRICGDLEVSIEELEKYVMFSFFGNKEQIKIFWDVVKELSNEERSNLLKFASGRRRLPVTIDVQSNNGETDSLPTAGTCSNYLYLPTFSSFEKALKNIRLAINSCVTIDTDTN